MEESVGDVKASAEPKLCLLIVEEPPDIGKKQIANLGFFVERSVDLFAKRVFHVPMLVGKGKRGPNLFEGCGISSPFLKIDMLLRR